MTKVKNTNSFLDAVADYLKIERRPRPAVAAKPAAEQPARGPKRSRTMKVKPAPAGVVLELDPADAPQPVVLAPQPPAEAGLSVTTCPDCDGEIEAGTDQCPHCALFLDKAA